METPNLSRAAQQTTDHPAVEAAARVGYAASGVMHLVIAWLAVQLAFGRPSGNADQSGAMELLSHSTWGEATLWVCVVGFAGLGLWQLAAAAPTFLGAAERLKALSKGVIYLALAWSAAAFARGGGQSGSAQTRAGTTSLMDSAGGRATVAAAGAAVILIGAYHVHKGLRRRFLRDLREHPGSWAVTAGRLGYAVKGLALAIVGGLFVQAAATADARQASGLDAAMRTVLAQPLGRGLLAAVAAGFAAFAVYCAARSRYGRV